MKEFLVTRKNINGLPYAEIVFFDNETRAWKWVESTRNDPRPALFVEEIRMPDRYVA